MKEPVTTLHARPQSDDDFIHAAHLMGTGGSFATSISRAYFCADQENRVRLRVAFPDLFTRYFNMHLNEQNSLKGTP